MKNLFFSLLVVGTAIGASAFTNAVSNKAVSQYLVQTSDGTFEQFTKAGAPSTNDACEQGTDHRCAYEVTPSGQTNITAAGPYSDSDINGFLSNGYIVSASPSDGLYNGPIN